MYYIGYDLGSSSIKVSIVCSKTGKNIHTLSEPKNEMQIISTQNDWAEQDPNNWWKHICNGTRRILKESKLDSSEIISIGISYQMHGLVIIDKKGNSLRNSIIWCDSRAVEIGDTAFNDIGSLKCSENLLNSPGNFTVSKLKWVKENEPDIYRKIYKFMLPGDYIAFKMTNIVNSTRNGLSEGILWDYKENKVAKWLLNYYKIDTSLTPNIVENFTNQGETTSKSAKETGLPVGIPITYRAGDQPNNALSLNVLKNGEVAATGGTSGVVYAVTNKLKSKESTRINHFAHVNYSNNNQLIGKLLCINGAGIMYKWLKKNTSASSYEEMNNSADKIPIGSNGLVVIPFGNGSERMFNNKNIGTHFFNLNLNIHSESHLYRASLEAIAFSFVYGIEIMKDDGTQIKIIKAGNDNLFKSDIFSNTVSTLINHDIEIYNTTGSVGAARASGLIDGDFDKFGDFLSQNNHVKTYKPNKNNKEYIKAYKNWKNELKTLLNK
ncbi:FGGY family carbohydrate kinase [Flavobacteriaceae bacterium]|nr:FGGY family carbohydrate kinase [Flavobacteriaceae bacterium]MDB4196567.1 FGGY family carbohydrate kinase [Flavobacteriaceae bacterium]